MQIQRSQQAQIERRLASSPRLIQVLVGPRQVGKTTIARNIVDQWGEGARYAAADLPLPPGPEWITTQWELARLAAKRRPALLVLDELQKVRGWSEELKRLWDEDRHARRNLNVLVLGSSALLLSQGMTESLAGRFFLHRCPHWNYTECHQAFGWDLDEWLYFGGYPGAAAFRDDEDAWRRYVIDSLIESVLARDVVAMQPINKPTLLRHLFSLSAAYPAQILSYTKMLGQLHEAGNTTTLASYLRALSSAFLVSGLERFSEGVARQRASSPKLVLWNNALINAVAVQPFQRVREDSPTWGRIVENAVGATLLNGLQGLRYELFYWKDRRFEVDYIVRGPKSLLAIEVKSGRSNTSPGLAEFARLHRRTRTLIVGSSGMPLEEFFAADLPALVG